MNLLLARNLANELLGSHSLDKWSFSFDRAKKRFGCCNFNTKTISLSRHLVELNTEDKVRDTLLHEIAHALVGPRCGHGPIWREKVMKIGGRAVRCVEDDVVIPKGKYTATCPGCAKKFQAQRKRRVACRECCKKFNKGRYSERFRICFLQN